MMPSGVVFLASNVSFEFPKFGVFYGLLKKIRKFEFFNCLLRCGQSSLRGCKSCVQMSLL